MKVLVNMLLVLIVCMHPVNDFGLHINLVVVLLSGAMRVVYDSPSSWNKEDDDRQLSPLVSVLISPSSLVS